VRRARRNADKMTYASVKWTASQATRSESVMRYIAVVAWCALIAGVLLRVTQLPTRTLFVDEAITQLRVAGHTGREMVARHYDGRWRTALALRQDATVSAKSSDTSLVASLIKEDAQHPPLYYVGELLFVRAFGDSLLSWRLLGAIFGILAIPAAYMLASTVFADPRAGLMAAAVFAVSPIERIYSTQAREYSLLTLLVLLGTTAIVHAVRENTLRSWLWYMLIAAAGLYTSPFMGYTIAAHGVYVIISGRAPRKLLAFGAALAAAVLLYVPWLTQLLLHRNDIAATNVWSAASWPFVRLAAKWIFNTGSTFFDLEYIDLRWAVLFVPVAIVAVMAVVRGFRASNTEARWLLGAAIAVPAILLVAPDILFAQHRSSVARYGLPVYAMLSILAGRGLAGRPIAATVLLAGGLCSIAVGSLHPSWWDNDVNGDDAQIASIINSAPHARVISSIPPPEFVTFARLLHDDVRVSLSRDLVAVRSSRESPVFVVQPFPIPLTLLEKETRLKLEAVSFARTHTAHEIGNRIGKSAIEAGTVSLYRATGSAPAR
jgi:hypothetical protein